MTLQSQNYIHLHLIWQSNGDLVIWQKNVLNGTNSISVKFEFRYESLNSNLSLTVFLLTFGDWMIEKKKENYAKNAFGQKKKKEETWIRIFNLG